MKEVSYETKPSPAIYRILVASGVVVDVSDDVAGFDFVERDVSQTVTRGIRNNNPGNIDRDGTKWEGMSLDQSADPRFIVFSTATFGIRALAKILISYQAEGFKTIRTMIDRWAPPVENDSTGYVDFVTRRVGCSADTIINFMDYNLAFPIVTAIIAQENADFSYPKSIVDAGLALAGIVPIAPAGPGPAALVG